MDGKKIRVLYFMNSCKNLGPTKQTLNIIKSLDLDKFEPILLTVARESEGSLLDEFLKYAKHYFVEIPKIKLVFNCGGLGKIIEDIEPDIIHSIGVIPDYSTCMASKRKHIITLRNEYYRDYRLKYGYLAGNTLAMLQRRAINNSDMVVCCSKSLSDIYYKRYHRKYEYIRNGVDTEKYILCSEEEKLRARKELGIDENARVFVYTGSLIKRKNVGFLLEGFKRYSKDHQDAMLLVVGDGKEYASLKTAYESNSIIFSGRVFDVRKYICASDIYVSASRSEGLPNGVIEAMAAGKAVLLSDILQHREVVEALPESGMLFRLDDISDFVASLDKISDENVIRNMGAKAYSNVAQNFDAKDMSTRYQVLYEKFTTS